MADVGVSEVRPELSRSWSVWSWLATVVIVSIVLWTPEFGDQALFRLGADEILHGGILYRDFWDIKQPGIYLWYTLGAIVGLDGLGVRVLEMVALLVMAGVSRHLARTWNLSPVIQAVCPLLVVVPYVLRLSISGVGQIEGLVNVFLLAQYALGLAAARRNRSILWLVSGLLGGTTLVFKTLLAPIVLVIFLGALFSRTGHDPAATGPPAWRTCIVWAAGLAVPIAAVFLYFAATGNAGLLYVTTFLLPPEVAQLPDTRPPGSFIRSVLSTGTFVTVTAVLAVPAVVALFRRGYRRRTAAGREVTLILWTLLATLLTFVQTPTGYRRLLLAVPIGLLAAIGAEWWRDWAALSRLRLGLFAAMSLVLALPLLVFPARLLPAAASEGFSLSVDARRAIAQHLSEQQRKVDQIVANRPPQLGADDSVYVFSDPQIYLDLGARQAIEMNGWSPDQATPEMWTETLRELERSRPRFIYVENSFLSYLSRSKPEILTFLDRQYSRIPSPGDPNGTWWQTESPGRSAPTPEGNRLTDLFANRR